MESQDTQFICARCAGLGKTCCQNSQVFMTRSDAGRIRAVVGNEPFSEYLSPGETYVPDFEADPVWARIFGPDGRRRILAHRENGDCCFLTPSGCRLPLTVRPLVCRLYPFDYNETTIKGVHPHFCPPPERDNPSLILALLAMNRDEAEAWRRMLYQEILEEFPDTRG